jgi:hypothetical protein
LPQALAKDLMMPREIFASSASRYSRSLLSMGSSSVSAIPVTDAERGPGSSAAGCSAQSISRSRRDSGGGMAMRADRTALRATVSPSSSAMIICRVSPDTSVSIASSA